MFKPGNNIAIKAPSHEYLHLVEFYRDILCLKQKDSDLPDNNSVMFDFDGKNLWIDCCPGMSQTEIWLEMNTDNIEAARKYLTDKQISFRHDIEPLPGNINAFWISSPGNIIHLIHQE